LGKAERLGYHILMYFLSPFLIFFSSVLFAFVTLNRFSNPPITDYSIIPYISALFALFFALPIFITISLVKIPNFILKNNQEPFFFGLKRIRKISIEKRLQVKPYLLILGVSASLIFLTVLVKNYVSLTGVAKFSALDSSLFLASYLGAGYLFFLYFVIYRQDERAVFFFRRFLRSIDGCYQGAEISMTDFEKGLKAYQKTLPSSYWIVSLEDKVKQLQFVLDRGSKEDFRKIQMLLLSMINAILVKDKASFDDTFSTFNGFLMEKASEKKDIIQIATFPVHNKWQITFRRMLWNALEKIMPYLILFLFIAAFYVIFNVKLPWI
jgi:hypothetical protein